VENSRRIEEEKNLKIHLWFASIELDLASNLPWIASNNLQEVKWMIKGLGFLEFQF
jgi:hypothetical protein